MNIKSTPILPPVIRLWTQTFGFSIPAYWAVATITVSETSRGEDILQGGITTTVNYQPTNVIINKEKNSENVEYDLGIYKLVVLVLNMNVIILKYQLLVG
eukprot:UN06586